MKSVAGWPPVPAVRARLLVTALRSEQATPAHHEDIAQAPNGARRGELNWQGGIWIKRSPGLQLIIYLIMASGRAGVSLGLGGWL